MTQTGPTYPIAMAALTALGLGACAPDAASVDPSGREAALGAARDAERHEEKRFLASYGGEPYRVNVRYVGMIGQSVIAVRRGPGDASGWPQLPVEAGHPAPSGLPFEAGEWTDVVLDIARTVGREGDVCPSGRPMAIRKNASGEASTMYRDERQAWVVFAICPKKAEG